MTCIILRNFSNHIRFYICINIILILLNNIEYLKNDDIKFNLYKGKKLCLVIS